MRDCLGELGESGLSKSLFPGSGGHLEGAARWPRFTVDVVLDGEGLVSRVGSALLAEIAEKTGLTGALSSGLAGFKQRVQATTWAA